MIFSDTEDEEVAATRISCHITARMIATLFSSADIPGSQLFTELADILLSPIAELTQLIGFLDNFTSRATTFNRSIRPSQKGQKSVKFRADVNVAAQAAGSTVCLLLRLAGPRHLNILVDPSQTVARFAAALELLIPISAGHQRIDGTLMRRYEDLIAREDLDSLAADLSLFCDVDINYNEDERSNLLLDIDALSRLPDKPVPPSKRVDPPSSSDAIRLHGPAQRLLPSPAHSDDETDDPFSDALNELDSTPRSCSGKSVKILFPYSSDGDDSIEEDEINTPNEDEDGSVDPDMRAVEEGLRIAELNKRLAGAMIGDLDNSGRIDYDDDGHNSLKSRRFVICFLAHILCHLTRRLALVQSPSNAHLRSSTRSELKFSLLLAMAVCGTISHVGFQPRRCRDCVPGPVIAHVVSTLVVVPIMTIIGGNNEILNTTKQLKRKHPVSESFDYQSH
jgi:hypothetical protein